MTDLSHRPLLYSCSGCSSAAQLANHLAVRMDRAGVAEMSCIAGVGGNVRSLVRKARDAAASGRPIIAIDGCALACVKSSLAQRGVAPTEHIQLAQQGVRKRYRTDFDPAQADAVYETLCARVRGMAMLPASSSAEVSTAERAEPPRRALGDGHRHDVAEGQ